MHYLCICVNTQLFMYNPNLQIIYNVYIYTSSWLLYFFSIKKDENNIDELHGVMCS